MVAELGVPVLHFDGTREALVLADGVMRAEWWLFNGPAPLEGALCWEGDGPVGRHFAAVREESAEADAQVRAKLARVASLVICRPPAGAQARPRAETAGSGMGCGCARR